MGTSTNGTIAYGVVCEEDQEFPWTEFDDGIEEWWRHANNFKDNHQPWTDDGEYAEGWSAGDPRFDEYFKHRREWMDKNPLPVCLENYCSGDFPIWAIVVPDIGHTCFRGSPQPFCPAALTVTEQQVTALTDFLEKHEIEFEDGPGWFLTSYWG